MIDRQKYLDRGGPPEEIGPGGGHTNSLEARMGQAYFHFLEQFETAHGRPPTQAEDDAISYTSVAYGRKQHELVTEFKAAHHRSPTEAEYQSLCQQALAYAEKLCALLGTFRTTHGRDAADEEYDTLAAQASSLTQSEPE
jgi:hypothetical protein